MIRWILLGLAGAGGVWWLLEEKQRRENEARAPVLASGIDGVALLEDPLPLVSGVRYRFRYNELVLPLPDAFWGPHTTLFRDVADLPLDWPKSLRSAESPLTRWGEAIWEGPSGPRRKADGLLQVWRAP